LASLAWFEKSYEPSLYDVVQGSAIIYLHHSPAHRERGFLLGPFRLTAPNERHITGVTLDLDFLVDPWFSSS
jgi:hypothetical protein